MAAKEEQDQHVAHVAFKIPNFWPHDPTTWFRKLESKFRICNISQLSMQYDHLLSALPTEVCSNINDSLEEIDENATDAYEQLKALLVARYTKDHWARAFELLKFPEIGHEASRYDAANEGLVAYGQQAWHVLHGLVPPPPPRRHDQPHYF